MFNYQSIDQPLFVEKYRKNQSPDPQSSFQKRTDGDDLDPLFPLAEEYQ